MNSQQAPLPKANIMIIDDTLDNLHLLSKVLGIQGYKVRSVSNGSRALKAARLAPPDLVLLDVRMPEMNGYEVCKAFKAHERLKDIPVLFLSVLDEAVDKLKGFEVGGVDYITKPFQEQEVLARVETHLTLRKMQQRLEEQNSRLQQEIAERKRAEDELRESEARAKTLANAIPDILDNATSVIFLKDIDGHYLLVNREFESLFRISKHDVLGKTDYDMFPKEMADAFCENDHRVIDADASLELEECVPHDDGLHTYMSIKFPLHNNDGELYGICGIATDITERKRAEERIKKLNQELEQRVRERTARLSEVNSLLRESEQRLKEAQRIARLGNWDWDIPTNELFWSDEIYRICGVAPQEFKASYETFLEKVHHEDRDAVAQATHAALYKGNAYSIDYRIVRPDHTIRIVHGQGEVMFDEQQRPIQMVGTMQDISKQKQSEEALRASAHQLRLITDNTPAYIAYVGIDDLRYRFVNRNFEIAYARPREQIIGRHIKDIIGEANYQFALRYIDIVKTGQPVSYVNSFPLEQGTRWIQVNYVPDIDKQGTVRAIVVMSLDVSEQKHTEMLLQQAKEAAEAASRAKSTFLANMSHELRTPLHGILGFAQILKQDVALTERQQQSADIIYRNGEHLLTLLNDVLDFTKIETRMFELRPEQFALPSLLRQLVDMAQLNAEHKGLSFAHDVPHDLPQIVFADQKRLRQILMNLLGNAVKFTQQGEVTFKVTDVGNGDFKFEISDTGLGIPPEQLESIFQPFQQADPYKLQEGSSGLGLAISQRLLKMMGSQLQVTSRTEGQGSTFYFDIELPVIKVLTSQGASAPLTTPEKSPDAGASSPPLPGRLPADWIAALRQAAEEN